jgi:hypothetical protein
MRKRTTNIIAWAVVAFLVGMLFTNHYVLSYVGGQINCPSLWMFWFIPQLFLPLWLVAVAAGVLIFAFFKQILGKATIIVCVMPSVLIIGMFVGGLVSEYLYFGEPGAMTFLRGFEKWAERNVDTGAIQEWIVRAPESYWGDPCEPNGKFYRAEEELPKELPKCFTEFKRQYVIFERSELDGSRIVRFGWGGGMFHWNLVVGDPNMKIPELTEEWYSDYEVEFRRMLKPGVYVYTRG